MGFLRANIPANPNDQALRYHKRNPGDGAASEEIFEVWGDLIDFSDRDPTEISDLSKQATRQMQELLSTLLDLSDQQGSGFSIARCSDGKDQLYLLVKWKGLQGEIGARPFGRCLDLFGILILPIKVFRNPDPNPLVRLSKLKAEERRDVTIFQSLLKYVLDQTGEAIDEQRII